MLEDGCLVEKGTYEELIQKDGLFAEFIHNYLKIKEINQKESEIGIIILTIKFAVYMNF
jgi:hypothetical protein